MMRLEAALARNPEAQVVFLGDLFHGVQNAETQAFREVLKRAPQDHFTLVLGNHDFHAPDWEEINCVDRMELGPMILVHEPPGSDFDHNIPFDMDRADQPGHYYVAGHLHPAAALRGKGRSRLMLPAFYFGDKLAVLPAFGLFTGRKALDAHGRFYGLAENSIIDLGVNPSKG
jgi:metallophosphoesterase superfamily enzyme